MLLSAIIYKEVNKLEYPYFTATQGVYASSNENYFLHCHDEYEIYMFFEGDSQYVIEDKTYPLSPGDVIIIRKREMHRVWHNSPKKYSRLTVTVAPEFFTHNNCESYEKAFLTEKTEIGNKINADLVRSSGLFSAILRFKSYTDNFTSFDSPIAKSILIEILYLIGEISRFEMPDERNATIKKVLNYINNNFTEDITLDALCERFFISKYYLCRSFKKHTGLTVQTYVREKRLSYFEELRREGRLLTECASMAGFNDYSVFYRAYVQKHKRSPEKK